MKIKTIFSILLVINTLCFGQNILEDKNGTLKESRLYIDTIITSNLSIANEIVFEKIETEGNAINIQQILQEKYETVINDSVEYYFIANLTDDTISISRLNKKIVGQDYGKFNHRAYNPLTLFTYPDCGVGIDRRPLKLIPRQILIIRSATKKSDVSKIKEPNCFIKIKVNDKPFKSKYFKRNFPRTDFYMDTETASYRNHFRYEKTF